MQSKTLCQCGHNSDYHWDYGTTIFHGLKWHGCEYSIKRKKKEQDTNIDFEQYEIVRCSCPKFIGACIAVESLSQH